MAREAMVRLDKQSAKFNGVSLENCGLLFLSTPHSGTTQAEWNELLLSLSEVILGVRTHAVIDPLRSFNPSSVDSEEAFATMRDQPSFRGFCEGKKAMVGGKKRIVFASVLYLRRLTKRISNTLH